MQILANSGAERRNVNTHASSVLWEPNGPGGQAKQAVRTACHVCEEQEAGAPALSAPCAGARASRSTLRSCEEETFYVLWLGVTNHCSFQETELGIAPQQPRAVSCRVC